MRDSIDLMVDVGRTGSWESFLGVTMMEEEAWDRVREDWGRAGRGYSEGEGVGRVARGEGATTVGAARRDRSGREAVPIIVSDKIEKIVEQRDLPSA